MGSLEGRTKMINDPLRVGNEGAGRRENDPVFRPGCGWVGLPLTKTEKEERDRGRGAARK